MDDFEPIPDRNPANLLTCPLCERQIALDYTTKHHLIPKSRKGKETIRLCRDCHKQLHVLYSPKELQKRMSTIELLKLDDKVKTWIDWISKRTSASRLKGSMKYR